MSQHIPNAGPVNRQIALNDSRWQNPVVKVHHTGVTVWSNDDPDDWRKCYWERAFPIQHLPEVLKALPPSAWPYGGIVLCLVPGLLPTASEEQEIEVGELLDRLDLEQDWPGIA